MHSYRRGKGEGINWEFGINIYTLLLLLSRFSCVRFSRTLCDPIDGSPSGSPIPGILQARILEWVAISFSNAWKWKGKVKSLSRVWLFTTPWTAAHQVPPSVGFSRQEYWSGLPLSSPSLGFRVAFSLIMVGGKEYVYCLEYGDGFIVVSYTFMYQAIKLYTLKCFIYFM